MSWWKRLWRLLFGRRPDLVLRLVEGDSPPCDLKTGELVVAREDGEAWVAALKCPCGCGDTIELALLPELNPHWALDVSGEEGPSLHPSIWRKTNCRSHFWVKNGHVIWCQSDT